MNSIRYYDCVDAVFSFQKTTTGELELDRRGLIQVQSSRHLLLALLTKRGLMNESIARTATERPSSLFKRGPNFGSSMKFVSFEIITNASQSSFSSEGDLKSGEAVPIHRKLAISRRPISTIRLLLCPRRLRVDLSFQYDGIYSAHVAHPSKPVREVDRHDFTIGWDILDYTSERLRPFFRQRLHPC